MQGDGPSHGFQQKHGNIANYSKSGDYSPLKRTISNIESNSGINRGQTGKSRQRTNTKSGIDQKIAQGSLTVQQNRLVISADKHKIAV